MKAQRFRELPRLGRRWVRVTSRLAGTVCVLLSGAVPWGMEGAAAQSSLQNTAQGTSAANAYALSTSAPNVVSQRLGSAPSFAPPQPTTPAQSATPTWVKEGTATVLSSETSSTFRMHIDPSTPRQATIVVARPNLGEQRIVVGTSVPISTATTSGFRLEDLDGDGDIDLLVDLGKGRSGGWTQVYLFNSATMLYEEFPLKVAALRDVPCFRPEPLSPGVIGSTCSRDPRKQDPTMQVFEIEGDDLQLARTLTVHFAEYEISPQEYAENAQAVYDHATEATSERVEPDGLTPRILCELIIPRRIQGRHKRFSVRITQGDKGRCAELLKFARDHAPD